MPDLPEDLESRTATLTTTSTHATTSTTPSHGPTLPGAAHPQPQLPHSPRPPVQPLDPGRPTPPATPVDPRPVPTFPKKVDGGHWEWGMGPSGTLVTTWVWDTPAPQPPQPPPPPNGQPGPPSAVTPGQPAIIPLPLGPHAPQPAQPPEPPPPPPTKVDPGNMRIDLQPDGTFKRQIYKGSPKLKVRITYRGGGDKLTITVTCDGQTQTLTPQAGETIDVEGDDISISGNGTWPQSANVDVTYP